MIVIMIMRIITKIMSSSSSYMRVLPVFARFREYTRGEVKTREPLTRGLSVNSISDFLSLIFYVYIAKTNAYINIQ